jgi:hypothetical protein
VLRLYLCGLALSGNFVSIAFSLALFIFLTHFLRCQVLSYAMIQLGFLFMLRRGEMSLNQQLKA